MRIRWKYISQYLLTLSCFVLLFKDILPGSLDQVLMILLAGLTLINNRWKIVKEHAIIWYGVYVIFSFIVTLYTSSSFAYFTTICFSFIVIYTVTQNMRYNEDLIHFLKMYAYFGILFCTYLIIVYHDKFGLTRFGNNGMLTGTKIDSSISLSYYLISICCVLIYVISEEQRWRVKTLLLIGLCECSLLILFSGVRKAILVPVLFYVMYMFRRNKKHVIRLFKYAAVLVLVLMVGIKLINIIPGLNRNLGDRLLTLVSSFSSLSSDSSISERVRLAITGLQLFYEHVFFGFGFDQTFNYFRASHNGLSHPHNNYILLLDIGGIAFFLSYYWGHIKVIVSGLKRYIKLPYEQAIILYYVILTLFSDFGTASYNIVFYNLFIGIGLCMYRLRKEDKCEQS